jgi:hypothetical protein
MEIIERRTGRLCKVKSRGKFSSAPSKLGGDEIHADSSFQLISTLAIQVNYPQSGL